MSFSDKLLGAGQCTGSALTQGLLSTHEATLEVNGKDQVTLERL